MTIKKVKYVRKCYQYIIENKSSNHKVCYLIYIFNFKCKQLKQIIDMIVLMHITYQYPPQPAIMFIVILFFLVIYVLCKHYAGATCILHCALFNNYYTRLPSHQLHLHKRRKTLRVSLPLLYIIVFWPFDNFPNGISWKGSVKQEK